MGRQGRKFLLEGPEKIPTHKDRRIRIFPHGMHTIDKAIGCSNLGGRGGGRVSREITPRLFLGWLL